MIRVIISIVALSLICTVSGCGRRLKTYAIRVAFSFDYKGRHFQESYLTVSREQYGNPKVSRYTWLRGRERISMLLPDGSVVVLSPEWPTRWIEFEEGRIYRSRARWIWLQSREAPKQVIYGDGATRRSSDRSGPAPFVWLEVEANVQRVADGLLEQAQSSDESKIGYDNVLYLNAFGGNRTAGGKIYEGLVIQPLHPKEHMSEKSKAFLSDGAGWVSLSGGCRMKPLFPGSLDLTDFDQDWKERRGLLADGSIWTGQGGPTPGEPDIMYPAGKAVAPTPGGSHDRITDQRLILNTIRSIRHDAFSCGGIDTPQNASGFIIEFEDRAMLVFPSGTYSIIGD